MSLVVILHVIHRHTASSLFGLLARASPMPVVRAEPGTPLAEDAIFVGPPDVLLTLEQGIFGHRPLHQGSGPPRPIDHFFCALAGDQGAAAVGMLLLGTGTDGCVGLASIRAAGGATLAQAPTTASHDSTPASAVGGGSAEVWRSPEALADKLLALARVAPDESPASGADEGVSRTVSLATADFTDLFADIDRTFGTAVSLYKPATLERRIRRRMMLLRIESPDEYLQMARASPTEMQALHRDLSIGVTHFFRDPEIFSRLGEAFVPQLLAGRATRTPLRIWVPACATGEEAYSLAMILLEVMDKNGLDHRVQIFASDIDPSAVQTARRGVYAGHIDQDLSAQRLQQFFVPCAEGYRVCRRLRDMVVFSVHDLLKSAPFSRMDLVSCRNLLIYLRSAAQRKLLALFHYALLPTGYLLLGSSETVGEAPQLFAATGAAKPIFARKQALVARAQRLPEANSSTAWAGLSQPSSRRGVTLQTLVERRLAEAYGPPGAVVNEHFDALHFCGDVGPFLSPAAGTASINILRLTRFDLHIELKRVMEGVLAGQRRLQTTVFVHDHSHFEQVQVDVMPLTDPHSGQRCLLVLFVGRVRRALVDGAPTSAEARAPAGIGHTSDQVDTLTTELKATQDYLKSLIKESDLARAGFRAANEELQSANEELQSTNEELETSKEELESTNEELITLNEELQGRMVELGRTHDDLHNILAGADTMVVIADLDLRIRRWTSAAEQGLKLCPQDIGRPLDRLEEVIGRVRLAAKTRAVIASLSVYDERILAGPDGPIDLRIRPYKTLDHAVRGAILRLTPAPAAAAINLARVLADIPQPLFAVDESLQLRWANDAFFRATRMRRRAHLRRPLDRLGPLGVLSDDVRARLRRAARRGERLKRTTLLGPAGPANGWTLGGSPVRDVHFGRLLLVVLEAPNNGH